MPGFNFRFPSQSVDQSKFIDKMVAYLHGRGRDLYDLKQIDNKLTFSGMCNGASALLLERVYIDCLHRHYQTKQPLASLLKSALTHFYAEIEAILDTPDDKLDSAALQMKLGDQKTDAYQIALRKLNKLIDNKKLVIPDEIKQLQQHEFIKHYVSDEKEDDALLKSNMSNDYFLMLLDLAKQQSLLSSDDIKLLRNSYIPEIALFERFISKIVLLQSNNENYIFEQHEFAEKFEQIQAKPIPALELDAEHALLITPEEFKENFDLIIPNNRIVSISLPKHSVAAFRIDDQLFFYDPNTEDASLIYCDSPTDFILKLGLSQLRVVNTLNPNQYTVEQIQATTQAFVAFYKTAPADNEIREWLANHPELLPSQIGLLKKHVLEKTASVDDDDDQDKQLGVFMPGLLSVTVQVFKHPESKPEPQLTGEQFYQFASFDDLCQREDFTGANMLMKLAKLGNEELFKQFMDKLQEIPEKDRIHYINRKSSDGDDALKLAIHAKEPAIVDMLLKAGANPNSEFKDDKSTTTPLRTAITLGQAEIVRLLIQAKANVNHKTDEFSPLAICCYKLEDHNANMNNIFNQLIKVVDLKKLSGDDSPLFFCVITQINDSLKKLLENGANPNVNLPPNSTSRYGHWRLRCTPLDIAVLKKDLSAVRLLLAHGAIVPASVIEDSKQSKFDTTMKLLLTFPFMAKGETKVQQLQLLFADYANPPTIAGIIPTTRRNHISLADEISKALLKPENRNLTDQQLGQFVTNLIEQKVPGGYAGLKDGTFKTRVDLVMLDLKVPNVKQDVVEQPHSSDAPVTKKPKVNRAEPK